MKKKTWFDEIAEEILGSAPMPNTQCQDCVHANVDDRGFRPDLGICRIYCNGVIKPGGVMRGLEPCENYKRKTD